MCQLVCLVVPLLQRDENAKIVLAGHHLDRGASELGCDLVETLGVQALLWAVDIERADGRVVRRLLGQVGDPDGFRRLRVRGGHGYCRCGAGAAGFDARGPADGVLYSLGVDPWGIIICFPVTLGNPSASCRPLIEG